MALTACVGGRATENRDIAMDGQRRSGAIGRGKTLLTRLAPAHDRLDRSSPSITRPIAPREQSACARYWNGARSSTCKLKVFYFLLCSIEPKSAGRVIARLVFHITKFTWWKTAVSRIDPSSPLFLAMDPSLRSDYLMTESNYDFTLSGAILTTACRTGVNLSCGM
jgi:hypothetical protein